MSTRLGRALFGLMLTIYLATAGGSLTTSDAVATFDVTRSIVETGSVAMSGNLLGSEAQRASDGRYYAPFGLGQSLFNIPFYVAAKVFVAATGVRIGKPDSLPKAFVALGETVVVAAIVQQFFALAVLVTGDITAALLAALTLGIASVLWPYSGFGFNQPLTCLTLLLATRSAFVATREGSSKHLVYSGLWLAASLMTRHEMALAAGPIAGWLWLDGRPSLRERVRRLTAFAPGVLAGVVTWLIYNAIRFGNPLDSGYLRDTAPGFGSPIGPGIRGLLLSPSTSIFLYSPFTIAGVVGLAILFKRDRLVALYGSLLILLYLLFYASLGNWISGRAYGSRYLLVVLPYFGIGWAALLAALSSRRRLLAWALVAGIGFTFQLPGVLIDYAKVSQAVGAAHAPFGSESRQWRWEASALVLNTQALGRALPENLAYVLGRRSPPAVAASSGEGDRSFSQQFSFSLDVWWLYLFYLHAISRAGLLVIVAGLAAAVAIQVWRLCERAYASEPARTAHLR